MEALGYPEGEPEVLLGQLVKLMRGGEPVRISKRTGNVITLADILDEVDPDVARLTFLLQGIDTTQTFDLDVVTAQSMENPVYYVQYAHARIASIGRKAVERGLTRLPVADTSLAPLVHERELDLLRALEAYPGVLAEAAELRAPHRVTTWVRDFAKVFHGFYRDCRVISDDEALTQARLWLAEASRLGLASALAILGVHAPDEMSRDRRRARTMSGDAPVALAAVAPQRGGRRAGTSARRRLRRRSSWRARSARRSTSTPRRSCAPAAASTATRSAPTRCRTRARRSCAWRWPGSSPRRACTSTSRPAASCTSRSAPGSPRRGSSSTATTSRTTSCAPRSRPASAASSPTPSTSSIASRRSWSPERRHRGSWSGSHPGSRRTPTNTSPPVPTTRSSASPSPTAPRARPRCGSPSPTR